MSPSIPAQPRSRLAPFVVWGVWAAMTAALLAYVWAFARDVPWWDDWDLVPVLSGREPATAAWLWKPHNEHRIPVPKLIHLALAAPDGPDFRAAAYVNALALAAGALALILAARRLRGHTSCADALFPLALLHWGQYDNLIWSFQVQFICSTVLFLVPLALMMTARPDALPWRGLAVGLCALVLPFCGANGAALAPALCLWLAAAALTCWRARSSGGRRRALLLGALAVLGAGAVVVSFLGYSHSTLHPQTPGAGSGLLSALLVLMMANGPAGAVRGGPLVGMFALLLALAAGLALGRAWMAGRVDRLRGLGAVACLGAVAALGVCVGWGRAGLHADSPGGITGVSRYVTLMAPLPCCAALACALLRQRLVPYLLLAAAAFMLPANTWLGWDAARWRADVLDRLTEDARRGVPPRQLSETYRPFVHAVDRDLLAERLTMLRSAQLGPYRYLPSTMEGQREPAPSETRQQCGRDTGHDNYPSGSSH
jgi:hypothetical protein